MTIPQTNRRTFPASLRLSLQEAAEARRRQLVDLRRSTTEGDVVAAAHRSSVERILGEVEAALQRLDRGTYGDCLGCGSAISLPRLTERPWAATCAWCVQR